MIDRARPRGQTVVVRADAAFAILALYEALEQRGVTYAIRLPANQVLERAIEDLLTRPRGRPSHAPLVRYRSIQYQAASWDRPRRVIAKVEHHLGELFPRVGFIVTTLTGPNRAVVRFYNQRGTAEQWIKEGKEATHWTRLACHRFRANEVRLLLGVIAYNLENLLRRLALPLTIQSWSLTSLQQRLFKTGGLLRAVHRALRAVDIQGRASGGGPRGIVLPRAAMLSGIALFHPAAHMGESATVRVAGGFGTGI